MALTTFVAVADCGGFASAARHLGLSAPSVTRTIAALEQHLGVSLLHRTTRTVGLTDEGAALLGRAREILAQLGEAEHEAMGGQATPRGDLYVTAPTAFGRLHVLPVVADMLGRHRDLSVRLLLVDRNIRLVEEGIDVAIRIGALRNSSLRSIRIGAVRQTLVASPEYCARRGRPDRPGELSAHDLIAGDAVRAGGQWRFGARSAAVAVIPRLTVTSVDAQLTAAEAGLGITNVLSYQAAAGLEAGRLCIVLDDHAPPPLPVHLLFDASRGRVPAVRLLIDGMRGRATAHAWG